MLRKKYSVTYNFVYNVTRASSYISRAHKTKIGFFFELGACNIEGVADSWIRCRYVDSQYIEHESLFVIDSSAYGWMNF